MKRVSSNTKLLESVTSPFDIECLLSDIIDVLWMCAGKPKFFYRKVMFCPNHVSLDDLNQMESIKSKLPDIEALKKCQKNFRKFNTMDQDNIKRDARLTLTMQNIETVETFFKELILRIRCIVNEKQKTDLTKQQNIFKINDDLSKMSVSSRTKASKIIQKSLSRIRSKSSSPIGDVAKGETKNKSTSKTFHKRIDKKYRSKNTGIRSRSLAHQKSSKLDSRILNNRLYRALAERKEARTNWKRIHSRESIKDSFKPERTKILSPNGKIDKDRAKEIDHELLLTQLQNQNQIDQTLSAKKKILSKNNVRPMIIDDIGFGDPKSKSKTNKIEISMDMIVKDNETQIKASKLTNSKESEVIKLKNDLVKDESLKMFETSLDKRKFDLIKQETKNLGFQNNDFNLEKFKLNKQEPKHEKSEIKQEFSKKVTKQEPEIELKNELSKLELKPEMKESKEIKQQQQQPEERIKENENKNLQQKLSPEKLQNVDKSKTNKISNPIEFFKSEDKKEVSK